MSYLLDTNVVSELRKGPRANAGVIAWSRSIPAESAHLSVLVVGELRRGVELLRRRDSVAGARLEAWLMGLLRDYADRVLPIDTAWPSAGAKSTSPTRCPPSTACWSAEWVESRDENRAISE